MKRRNDAFRGTQLEQILAEHQIGNLVLVGLDAAGCVRSTALAALNRGYEISLIEEAVIAGKKEEKTEALEELNAMGVEIVSMD